MQPVVHNPNMPHLIGDKDDDKLIAIFFCFGAFRDKHSGVVYNNFIGAFPFMLLDGCVCFFVLCHYKSDAILVILISGMDNLSIFKAYKKQFNALTAKGLKPKINIMDNQATKHIKNFLTEQQCKMQLLELHNHQMNAAKHAIQTYKDAFIAALATTDRDFPIQLWEKLAPQVQDTLTLLRASRINPAISAYKILNGPYDWNRYPLAPCGCKAVVYKDGDTRGSWASRGMGGWYLGPSQDHYKCDLYYIPEMRVYWIFGSTELFPQHCQVPNLTAHQHLWALTNKLAENTTMAGATPKGLRLIKLLQSKTNTILTPPDSTATQRAEQRVREEQQRVIDETPILTIPCITNVPPIMQACNPMSKRALKNTPQINRQVTRNNTPGGVPMINNNNTIPESNGLDMMPQ
jgi:hypothetical protein